MLFTTPRLVIRSLKETDLPHFYRLQSSEQVMQYVGGCTMTWEESEKDLEKIIRCYRKPGNDFRIWAVLLKENNQWIGTCALVKNEKGEQEIGYRFLETSWGKGYGKELVKGLVEYAFTKLKIKQIVAYAARENKASVKILDCYFNFLREVYNEKDKCTDRVYVLYNDLLK